MHLSSRPPRVPTDGCGSGNAQPSRRTVVRRVLARAFHAAFAAARSLRARHRQWRRAKVPYDTLWQLDDHTLRDLGLHRSEIASLTARAVTAADARALDEVSYGDVQRSRVAAHGVPAAHAPHRLPVAPVLSACAVREPLHATP